MKNSVFWFRRDLRIEDNHGLFKALSESSAVQCLFILDSEILEKLEQKKDARLVFIIEALIKIKRSLLDLGSDLQVEYGKPAEVFAKIISENTLHAVYANQDYEPYARTRDQQVSDLLRQKGIEFKLYKDQVIFEQDEITKENGLPYTVFTPYSKKWISEVTISPPNEYQTIQLASAFKQTGLIYSEPSLEKAGFLPLNSNFPNSGFDLNCIKQYHTNRDFPGISGTSRLGVHLRFGTISIRKLVLEALQLNAVFLNELIWREFYMMILWHFPQVQNQSFKSEYDGIAWVNDENAFYAWCNGRTGFPMVDAGMRELNETGFMHNRSRMITAGFLTKLLLTDWRWGEAYFAEKLLDYDLSANNGGWQWAAGCGTDAAPYFRIFNPDLQQKRFDPEFTYIRKWIPEFGTQEYPMPIIDYKQARERALKVYKAGLQRTF